MHWYQEAVHWKKNLFLGPPREGRKTFVSELARLYRAYAEGTALESITLKCTTVMSILLLQKPHNTSKTKEHIACLERRLRDWKTGSIYNRLQEGQTISITPSQEAELQAQQQQPKPRS